MAININELDQVLIKTASRLDIPDDAYEDAVVKYEAVGAWLASDESDLNPFAPEIYPQGSFRLGTVVHPLAVYDYDIDLVCVLNRTKEQISQKELKQIVGTRLKQSPALKSLVSSGCRCWLVDYPAETGMPGFHMDVLPAMPNPERPTGIFLTDTELFHWQRSNPKAYADWFFSRMISILTARRAAAAMSASVDVEDVPEWQVKTPLQMTVQLLKRHRDVYFQPVPDDRPASIILTTLAAMAYRGQPIVYNALLDVMAEMPRFIERRGDKWWIGNPTEIQENFADRWNQNPERHANFLRWLKRAQEDFSSLIVKRNLGEAIEHLGATLGTEVMTKVAQDLGFRTRQPLVPSFTNAVPGIGGVSHRQPGRWFRNPVYSATLKGAVYYNRQSKKPLWPLVSTRPISKGLSLRFELKTNAPQPYEIIWQVVNTGNEAEQAGDLRGGFYPANGHENRLHWETTKYRGTHWVEAHVVRDGVLVATSKPFLVRVR
jgi:hypothetical protein